MLRFMAGLHLRARDRDATRRKVAGFQRVPVDRNFDVNFLRFEERRRFGRSVRTAPSDRKEPNSARRVEPNRLERDVQLGELSLQFRLDDASNFRVGAAVRDPGDDRRREESEKNAPTENDFDGFKHCVDANERGNAAL